MSQEPHAADKASQQGMLFDVAPAVVATRMQPVARVQLEDSASLELDYAIPENLVEKVRVGTRVIVPLQRQKVNGVVLDLFDHNPNTFRLKEILSLQGRGEPVFTPALIKLAHWLADYYVCPVHQVLRTMLPQAVRAKPESFLTDSHLKLAKALNTEELDKLRKKAPMQARLIDELKAKGGEATLSALRKELPQATTLLKSLVEKGWITRAEIRVERDPFEDEEFLPSQAWELNEEQKVALDHVLAAMENPKEASPFCSMASPAAARPRSSCKPS